MPKDTSSTPQALAVRWLCAYVGWSRRNLARRSGIAESTLYHYENGDTAPGLDGLDRLAAAVAFPLPVEVLLTWCRNALSGEADPPGDEIPAPEATDLLRLAGERVIPTVLPVAAEPPPPAAADRDAVPALWQRLGGANPKVRRALIVRAPEFWHWALAERLCDESRQAAARSAGEALELARLAREIARRLGGDPQHRRQVEGFAEAHLGNALRVGGSQPQALAAFVRAKSLWKAGALNSPGLLDKARFLSLEVSLRRDRRELHEAFALAEQALAGARGALAAELVLQKANVLELLGNYAGAIATLRQAEPALVERREQRLLWLQRCALMVNLCHLGRAGEAEAWLPEVLALAAEHTGALDHLRLDWLRGRIAAGLGRRVEAAGRLDEVRQAFEKLGIAYDTALVSVELAAVYLEDGRTAEARALARQMMPILRAQGVPVEVLKALRLFTEAVRRQAADAELARRVVSYLYRAQGDPKLRFENGG